MTNQQHPITPPPELVKQWRDLPEYLTTKLQGIATQAARWGADQELDACCAYLAKAGLTGDACGLQLTRRPKPPSLKEQAMKQLQAMEQHGALNCNVDTIRRALEQLYD